MNIFGVGGAELVLIIVIMLIVAGPRRMVRWAYRIGQYVGKFRMIWEQVVDVLQDEVDAAGLDVKIPKEIPTRQSIAQTANDLIKPYAEQMEKAADEVKNPLKETIDETNKVVTEAQSVSKDALKDADEAVKESKSYSFKPAEGSVVQGGAQPAAVTNDVPANEPESDGMNFGAWSQPTQQNQPAEGEA